MLGPVSVSLSPNPCQPQPAITYGLTPGRPNSNTPFKSNADDWSFSNGEKFRPQSEWDRRNVELCGGGDGTRFLLRGARAEPDGHAALRDRSVGAYCDSEDQHDPASGTTGSGMEGESIFPGGWGIPLGIGIEC